MAGPQEPEQPDNPESIGLTDSNPQTPSEPPVNIAGGSVFWRQMGVLGVMYITLLVFTVITHPFSKQFIEPIAAFVFPIAEGNTMLKSVIIISVFYWVPALIRLGVSWKKN